jgi:hypothetical protein
MDNETKQRLIELFGTDNLDEIEKQIRKNEIALQKKRKEN